MRRWTAPTLVICTAVAAAAQIVPPSLLPGPASRTLIALAALAVALVTGVVWLRDGARSAAAAGDGTDAERRYEALFEACGDAVCAFELTGDGPGAVVAANETACMALGHPRSALLAMSWDELCAPEVRRSVRRRMTALREARSLVFESMYVTSDGHRLPVELSLRRVDESGRRLCLAVARDVSELHELAEATRDRSRTDELTGVLSRRGFFGAVGEVRQRARRLGAQVLVVHAELTGLKDVNDRLGHAAGDALVKAVADVLTFTFRGSDVVARLCDDEFAALAVLGRSDRERVDWQAIVARFDQALAAKRAELGDELGLTLRYGSRVADWEELDHIDRLLALTRRSTPLGGPWTARPPIGRATAKR